MPQTTNSTQLQLDFFDQIPEEAVHIIPSAARKSSALGLFKFWRIYALLKHLDRIQFAGHSRFLLTRDLIHQLAAWCKLKPVTVRRILRSPKAGLFWAIDDHRVIHLVSRRKVEAGLTRRAAANDVYDAHIVSRSKGLLSIDEFSGLQRLEAAAFDAWLATRKNGHFTGRWVDLQAAWGRERTTLLRWLKLAGAEIIRNYATIPVRSAEAVYDAAVGASYDNHIWYETIDDETHLVFQRANTYVTSDYMRAGLRGTCRDIAGHLQRAGLNASTQYVRTNHDVREKSAGLRLRYLDRRISKHGDRRHYSLKVAHGLKLRRGRPHERMNRWRLEYVV